MLVKDIIDEDFINYKVLSMFIITNRCDFKCCKEACNDICQNMSIVNQADISISTNDLIERYVNNPTSKAIVFGV